MTLKEGSVGENYFVTDLHMEDDIMRRLEVLGINDGTKVEISGKKKDGSVIIKVRGTRLAIGRKIAGGIVVKEIESNEAN